MNVSLYDEDLSNISFKTVNSDGVEVLCDVLASYHDDDTDSLYVVFTDYFLDGDRFKCYVNEIVFNNDSYILKEVDDNIRNYLIELTSSKEDLW